MSVLYDFLAGLLSLFLLLSGLLFAISVAAAVFYNNNSLISLGAISSVLIVIISGVFYLWLPMRKRFVDWFVVWIRS
jgi:hypothetical protein